MADFSAVSAFAASELDPDTTLIDSKPGAEAFNSAGEGGPTLNFKMRAVEDPGPDLVTWIVQDEPDFAGTFAPETIQAGTAVVAASWTT